MKNKRYEIVEKSNVKLIQFTQISNTGMFIHGFSTRIGGVSPPPYDTMNLGFSTDDENCNLEQNRKIFHKVLGIGNLPFVQRIDIVHGNTVFNIEQLTEGILSPGDGLVTNQKNIPICTTFADCIPIFLADPATGSFAVIHAGWRGSFAEIAAAAVKKMTSDFNCKSSDIIAGIGPGIGKCCFEIGNEVTEQFFSKFNKWKDLITKSSNNNTIDLLNLNKRILMESGCCEANITICDLCTFCNRDLFFSYRRDGKKSGRMSAVMARIT